MSFEILSVLETRAVELKAAEAGLPPDALMENAGRGAADIIAGHLQVQPILVLCGSGNNGGDGFIAARELKKSGWPVTVACLVSPDQLKGDAARAASTWNGPVFPFSDVPVHAGMLVVDAVFGTGFRGVLPAPVSLLFNRLKDLGCYAVALDLPSGVDADLGTVDPATLPAFLTIAFIRRKTGHMLMPGRLWCGVVSVLDAGVGADVVAAAAAGRLMENHADLWRGSLPRPSALGHKYHRGHVTVFGAGTMPGAVRLAASASARTGAGLVSIASCRNLRPIYQAGDAHIMVDSARDMVRFTKDMRRNVFVLGPGCLVPQAGRLRALVRDVAVRAGRQAVLDAGALRAFAGYRSLIERRLHEGVVLTPHDGEFADLFPDLAGSRADRARRAAQMLGAVIVLKGPDTVIAHSDGRAWIQGRASPYLATAGTGDVLSGMIAGFMAQGVPGYAAAQMAVGIHAGLATEPDDGLVASDLVTRLPDALGRARGVAGQ